MHSRGPLVEILATNWESKRSVGSSLFNYSGLGGSAEVRGVVIAMRRRAGCC